MKNRFKTSLASTVMTGLLFSMPAHSGWFGDNLIDPEDGMMDASDYLASAKGFLPVPIIITEPAVGFGLGFAVAYFHAPKELEQEEHPHQGPPSITVGFGGKTENGTYFYGGAHSGVWKDDHIRYLGALAKMNVNTSFYPGGIIGEIVGPEGVEFNIDGGVLYQELKFRLKESSWWLGSSFVYVNADNIFKLNLPIDFLTRVLILALEGLSVLVEYDGRNSTFTPTKGISGKLEFQNYDELWGSDFNYDHLSGSCLNILHLGNIRALVCA